MKPERALRYARRFPDKTFQWGILMRSRRLAILSAAAGLLPAVTALAAPGPVFPDDRSMGSPKAPVQIVEYAAPACPHCAYFAKTVLPELKKTFIDTGKVHYVLRIFPISPYDGAIAGMAVCLPKERYFEFLDLAFQRQDLWDPDGNSIPDVHAGLVKLGALAGLPAKKVDECIANDLEMARDFPRESRLFANEILQGAPRIMPLLEGELKELVDEKAEIIKGWMRAGKIVNTDPWHLIFSIWATTQHYADFGTQIRALTGKGIEDEAFYETTRAALTRILLEGVLPSESGSRER